MARTHASKLCIAWYLVLSCLMLSRTTHADTSADIRLLGRKTTALIRLTYDTYLDDGNHRVISRGTAFCITRSGYFVTDAHVLGDATEARLMVERPGRGVFYYNADVVKSNKTLDLAVLKVEGAEDAFVPLEIAAPASITRGMHVTAFGFPASEEEVGVREEFLFSPVRVRSGQVTALYGKGQTLTDVQTNTSLGPGSSGGPVLNDRGQLVGIIQKGKRGSKAMLAKSVNALLNYLATPELAAKLNKPDLRFSPPSGIPASEITREHKFEAKFLAGLASLKGAQVELTLSSLGTAPRVYHSALSPDGSCAFLVPPLPPLPQPHTVTLTLFSSDGAPATSLQAMDRVFSLGSTSFALSQISRIDQGAEPVVTLSNGALLLGRLQGADKVWTRRNGEFAPEDLSGAKRIVVRDDTELPRMLQYRLSVLRANKTLFETSGRIFVEGLPARRMGQPIVIACGTAWATNNTGSNKGHAADLSPSVVRYIQNIADLFTGGAKSNLLILSDHWTFGAPFQEVLRSAGHTVTVSLDPGPLEQYDAIFVGGHEVDQGQLIAYVKQGGKVYVSGGRDAKGDMWNGLLNAFGLQSQKEIVAAPLPGSGFAYAPLFDGVKDLNLKEAMYLTRSPQAPRDTQIVVNQSQANLWALYRAGEKLAPEPPPPVVVEKPSQRPVAQAPMPPMPKPPFQHEILFNVAYDQVRGDREEGEREHHLKEEKSTGGNDKGIRWRSAEDGGWFSYELKIKRDALCELRFGYLGIDADAREFDIFIDGVKMTEVKFRTQYYLMGAHFRVPPKLLAGKEYIVVKFQAHPGKTTGRIYDCTVAMGY